MNISSSRQTERQSHASAENSTMFRSVFDFEEGDMRLNVCVRHGGTYKEVGLQRHEK